MAAIDFDEIVRNLKGIADSMRVRPPLRAGVGYVAYTEVSDPCCTKCSIVAIGNSKHGIFIGPKVISKILRVKPIEPDPQFVHRRGRKRMVVPDCRVVVSGLCIDVINLDESGTWRRSGEVTSLEGLPREQPVTIPELVVDLHVELMIIVGRSCIRVER